MTTTVECQGCGKALSVDAREARWVKPFSGVSGTDEGQRGRPEDRAVLPLPVVFDHPEPGAEPYCAGCRPAAFDALP